MIGLVGGSTRQVSGCFCVLGELKPRGGLSAHGLNRIESGIGLRSGQLESIEWPRRCSWRCPGGQAEMSEDLGDHVGVFDGGDDLQRAAAVRAFFNIDLEGASFILHLLQWDCPYLWA